MSRGNGELEELTPLHLSILLHYYCLASDYEDIHNPTIKEYALNLCQKGYLYRPLQEASGVVLNIDTLFIITDYGRKRIKRCLVEESYE